MAASLRNQLLRTKDQELRNVLKQKIGNMITVQKGYFCYEIAANDKTYNLSFKFDEISNINVDPKDSVRVIASNCDCLTITDTSNNNDIAYWQYDADN